MIDPKKQFQESLPPDSKFRNIILSKEVQTALTLSFTCLALESQSPEQLAGAKRFVEILTSIAENPTPAKSYMDKPLIYEAEGDPRKK